MLHELKTNYIEEAKYQIEINSINVKGEDTAQSFEDRIS